MRLTDTGDLWWKTAVVYCLDIETFMDFNDDGVGDFEGLAHRIDYLAELGVTCLWLMPFYPTPGRDDGYDIIDFYGVDPRLGHHGDLVEVLRTAKDRGMRVIADLVVNHTSDQHPWFKAARSSKDNPYRDFYVWRDEIPPNAPTNVFPDKEDGVWQLDEKTGQYYLHNFYRHQPDLNLANPKVRDEIAKVIGYWMELGFSGFRVDAVPFLKQDGDPGVDPHELLRSLRKYLTRRAGDSVLLGEVNLPFEEQYEYFGGEAADELTMQFDFVGMQKIYLSLARQDARPLADSLRERPVLAQESQCATTTSSPWTSSARPSAWRSSRRSPPTRGCACSIEASAADCRRCSRATRATFGWSTACCSRCPVRPSSSTARRSAWARTSSRPAGSPCARPCSGTRPRTADSRGRVLDGSSPP